jgi:hypothetical protein
MRASIEVETLLKIILLLVLVWLALEIVGEVIGILSFLLGPLSNVFGLVIVIIIILWWFDYI